MDCRYNSGDVCIAVCCCQARFGMFGNGVVHAAVLHRQSGLFRSPWIQLWQGYTQDVESSFSVVCCISRWNMAVLRHQGSVVYNICHGLSDYRVDGNGNKQIFE